MIGYTDSGYRLWSISDKKIKISLYRVIDKNKTIADPKVDPGEVSDGRLIKFSLLDKEKEDTIPLQVVEQTGTDTDNANSVCDKIAEIEEIVSDVTDIDHGD